MLKNMNSNELLKKVKSFSEADKVDLSSKEDLGIAVMNLIAIEEHLFYTYEKTKKQQYLDLLNEARQMRKKYLAEIVKQPEGEIWCTSKHLMAASMRLIEVGTKKLGEGDKGKAKELFDNAYGLWNMFWGLNLGLLDIKDVKRSEKEEEEIKFDESGKTSIFDKLGKIVNKILDCCRE
jgi:hypothetical protein